MKQLHVNKTDNSGQTLVEAVVVVGMVMLLVTGLIAGTTSSLRSARIGRSRSLATKFAQDGMEYIRSIRDTNWNTFFSYSGTYCPDDDNVFVTTSEMNPCSPNIIISGDSFTRQAEFEWDGTKMHVTVTVSFLDGEETKTVDLKTYFTEWK